MKPALIKNRESRIEVQGAGGISTRGRKTLNGCRSRDHGELKGTEKDAECRRASLGRGEKDHKETRKISRP